MIPYKRLSDETGAISFIEGAYLFPIVFFVIFFLVFLTFLFWAQINDSEKANRALQKPISSPVFANPNSGLLNEELGGEASIEVHGLFFKELQLSEQKNARGAMAFRYFDLPEEINLDHRQKVRWASSTENLRHYMAIMRWMKKEKKAY